MNKRTNITLCHVENMNGLLDIARKSHGPVCLMDKETAVCDLREESVVTEALKTISKDGGVNEMHLSIPAEDMPMYLAYMIYEAA